MEYELKIQILHKFLRLLLCFRLGVDCIHGSVDTDCGPSLYTVDDSLADVGHVQQLVFAEFAKNIIHLLASSEAVADADADSGILLCSDHLVDVGQAVVTARASVLAQTQCSERDIQVVRNHDQILYGNLELVHPVTHCLSAEVHVSGRFQEMELPALE